MMDLTGHLFSNLECQLLIKSIFCMVFSAPLGCRDIRHNVDTQLYRYSRQRIYTFEQKDCFPKVQVGPVNDGNV